LPVILAIKTVIGQSHIDMGHQTSILFRDHLTFPENSASLFGEDFIELSIWRDPFNLVFNIYA